MKYKFLLLLPVIWVQLTLFSISGSVITLCDESHRYEYDLEQCPGGIQIRDENRWFSDSRDQTCLCGDSQVLHFEGKIMRDSLIHYPIGFPLDFIPKLGYFFAYSLTPACELLQGNHSSALLISLQKYLNPSNFPTRAVEILVKDFERDRLPGNIRFTFSYGLNNRHMAKLHEVERSIIFNTADPVLMVEKTGSPYLSYSCAYNSTHPRILLSRYLYSTWGNQDLAQNCEKNLYPAYRYPTYLCPLDCPSLPLYEPPEQNSTSNQPSLAFRQILLTMAEVAIRLKHAQKFITFTKRDLPYVSILQHSCRVFHRAFPQVIRWETLMSAVSLFGVTFEGLVPTEMHGDMFEHMKIFLGRCTIQEGRRQREHAQLLAELCPEVKGAVENALNSSIANVKLDGNSHHRKRGATGEKPQPKLKTSFGEHNVVVELLWKVVQFVHANCLASTDHFPNVHHAYTSAMIEMFSSPAVQLVWYQQGKFDYRQLGKAMVHVFPELPDHVIPTMELLLQKGRFESHSSVLVRPKIENLDERDMRCAGHGQLIWGGRACCYKRSEDNNYYYFNKVGFAKL